MILKDFDSRKKLLDIFKDMYEHVSISLGPNGNTAIIKKDNGKHIITKDGVTIVKNYKASDELGEMMVDIIKEMSQRTDMSVGDGTTSTIVFAYHLFKELFNLLNSGNNYADVMNGVDSAITKALTSIGKYKQEVNTLDQVGEIAYVSSNSDKEVADIIKRAIDEVGNHGSIVTSRNRKYNKTLMEVKEGYTFESGWISPEFITNKFTKSVEYHEPRILVTDYPIYAVNDIIPVLKLIHADHNPLVIIAKSIKDEALASVITNVTSGAVKVTAINAPYYGEEQDDFFEDICDITGATLISRKTNTILPNVRLSDLGRCEKFDSRKNETTIINGAGDFEVIEKKLEHLRESLENADTPEEVEELNARINRLVAGIAVIMIGGYTEAEINEKKYRYDDALGAIRAAYKSGTVVGGGITYINVAGDLESVNLDEFSNEYRLGYRSVIKALHAPFNRLVEGANMAGREEIILKEIKAKQEEGGYECGYDMLLRDYCNLRERGIIEPTLIMKNVLKNSYSIVKLLLNSKAIIL
jgi:chaperonin GroEL